VRNLEFNEVVVPLTIRDLSSDDLRHCAWTGSATHRASMAAALDRVALGEVDYLAACPPSGLPVGLTAIDYVKMAGAGTLWMVEVHDALRSCGIGTTLIHAAERRIRARGLARAELAVEHTNPRARALYDRLGYVAYGSEPDGWDEEAPDGSTVRYETMCTLMRKELPTRARFTR
jgi:ribosomal protein S18 acetylase RimI-like enzyme